jgi:hypothetical protein
MPVEYFETTDEKETHLLLSAHVIEEKDDDVDE